MPCSGCSTLHGVNSNEKERKKQPSVVLLLHQNKVLWPGDNTMCNVGNLVNIVHIFKRMAFSKVFFDGECCQFI